MDGQCLLPSTVLPSKFDRLNFDGLAGKRQNCQNFPPLKFPAIRYVNLMCCITRLNAAAALLQFTIVTDYLSVMNQIFNT